MLQVVLSVLFTLAGCLLLLRLRLILGDLGADSRAGRKGPTKVLKHGHEPLGTDSHRTISKRSREPWLLIGHKKCFVLLCPIGEQFLLSSFREFVHDGYYLATVARFVHQAFLDPETKELPMSRKTFRMLPAGAIQFALRKSFLSFSFWRITMYRK